MESPKLIQSKPRLRAIQLGVAVGLGALFVAALLWGLQGMIPAHADPDTLYEPPAPYLRLRVNQTHDWVDACTSFGATVGITVTAALGNVKGIASGVALRDGGCIWGSHFHWSGSAPDIVVGDRIDGSSSDGSTATATVITIVGQIDVEANTVSGQVLGVSYPAAMRGEVWEEGVMSPETQTDDQGHFTLDFNPLDIQPWMEVTVWYIQPDGNWGGGSLRQLFCIDTGIDTGLGSDLEDGLRPFDGDGLGKNDMGASERMGTIQRVYLPPTLTPALTEINDSSTFFVGGIVEGYLAEKVWDGCWKQVDPLRTLHENGFDWATVRLTTKTSSVLRSTPPSDWGDLLWDWYYFGSLEYVEQMMIEASDIGMKLNLVFYLSDEEAHGGRQNAPPEWQDLTLDELVLAVQDYCYETTKYFKDRGFHVEIYDIGNEIDFGILNYRPGEKVPLPPGVTDPWKAIQDLEYMKNNVWNIEAKLLKSAIAGVKDADPDAKITLHVHKMVFPLLVTTFFETMIEEGVEFDYAGLSYPPAGIDYWVRFHDHPASWMQPIIDSMEALGKKVIISEFLYPYCILGVDVPQELLPNPPKWRRHVPIPGYPFTPEGQAKAIRDMISFWRENENVIGVFYFCPDTIGGDWYWFDERDEGHPILYGYCKGLFETDTEVCPAILQFGSTPPSFPTVDLVDEMNEDWILVNETDASFVWIGEWGSYFDDCHVGGTRKLSGTPGAKVDIQFTGTAISLIYHEAPAHGIAEIAVDGVPYPDVDMYDPESRCRAEKVIATNLASSEHVLTITVSGRKNSSSTDILIVVDAVRVLQGTSPSSFLWSGDWERDIDSGYSGATRMGSSESGARASITFTGTGIALVYATNDDHGIAEIEIDGVRYLDIDMYSPEFVFRVTDVITTDLAPSEHVLTITVSGDKNPSSSDDFIVVDAVDVIQARPVPTHWIYLPTIMKSYQLSS